MIEQDELVAAIQEIDPEGVIAQHGPFVLTKTGALATGEPTFDEWEAALKWCQRVERYSPFWIGDLIAFGESRYGETYAQAMEVTGQTYGTLANAVYVATNVPPERRRPALAFGFHQEVAPLLPDEQDQWLEHAEAEGLTQTQLRQEIRLAKATAAGHPVELRLLVKCANPTDQGELAERMKAEGRAVKLQLKETKD